MIETVLIACMVYADVDLVGIDTREGSHHPHQPEELDAM
jgi:hypothetical protein